MTALQTLWIIIIVVLWTGFLVLDGFDLGVGMILRVVARNDDERAQVTRSIGPHWDGNEVWLITALGATFAAFPEWYATMLSGLYFLFLGMLLFLIMRVVAVVWRDLFSSHQARNVWDCIHMLSAWAIPLFLGMILANLTQGMPIQLINPRSQARVPPDMVDPTGPPIRGLASYVHAWAGTYTSAITWYSVCGGLVLIFVCATNGAMFLSVKTVGDVAERARKVGFPLSIISLIVVMGWVGWGQQTKDSSWWGWVMIVIVALAYLRLIWAHLRKEWVAAFVAQSCGVIALMSWIFISNFPFVIRSSIDPNYSLSVQQAAATEPTLIVLTVVAAVVVPCILTYTAWSYWAMRKPIALNDVVQGLPKESLVICRGETFVMSETGKNNRERRRR